MNIADFSVHAEFEGHANMARMQPVPADLASFVFAAQKRRFMIDIGKEVLAEHYPGISMAEVMGNSRIRKLVEARQHVWWEVKRQRPDATTVSIARRFNRDHQTVNHGLKKHASRIAKEAA
jgi:chromosomal replication initiation ATPase DnaA